MNKKIIIIVLAFVLVFESMAISLSLYSSSVNNAVCEFWENPVDNYVDCWTNAKNNELIGKLAQRTRPIISGININNRCTLGMVVNYEGETYALTAGHCEASKAWQGVLGSMASEYYTAENEIGGDCYVEGINDICFIRINEGVRSATYKDYFGNDIYGFGSSVYVGMEVYKIGIATGLTFGKVTEIDQDDMSFKTDIPIESGDSGSAIISVDRPHKIIGVVTSLSRSPYFVSSPLPNEIAEVLDK